MALKLIFFAKCAEWMGCREMSVDLPEPAPVGVILQGDPVFAPILENRKIVKIAVNQNLAEYETRVKDGDEVAFLPPVSGG